MVTPQKNPDFGADPTGMWVVKSFFDLLPQLLDRKSFSVILIIQIILKTRRQENEIPTTQIGRASCRERV